MERQQFGREFKAQAVRLCEQDDVSIAQLAQELGVDVKLLYRWRREALQVGADASWSRTTDTPLLELDTLENPFRDRLADRDFRIQADGTLVVPTGPGLGIEIDEALIRHHLVCHAAATE